MPAQGKVENYFRHVVEDYNCGDIRALIERRLEVAGPLLSTVVGGIDLVGGMMDGFNQPSSNRSIAFMKKWMNLADAIARLLYSLVRCGVAHEGTTKLNIHYFVSYDRICPGIILYGGPEGSIWLNVTEFAHAYLAAVADIGNDVTAHLNHVPVASARDEADFAAASNEIHCNIDGFALAAFRKAEEADQAKFDRGEIKMMSSSTHYISAMPRGFTTRLNSGGK
jgi:hypothetical protein